MECHSKWNVIKNGMSLKSNVTQIGMSNKLECHTNWDVTQINKQIEKIVNPKTSKCAYIGKTLILSVEKLNRRKKL